MFKVNSERARKILQSSRFFLSSPVPEMRVFPSEKLAIQVKVESENGNVKNLSFFGEVPEGAKLVMESMASLLIGKKLSFLSELSIRECEAFLRDRNSVPAFEDLPPEEEEELKRFFNWLKSPSSPVLSSASVREYEFPLEKGPFQTLSLVDKVRELKAFLNSPEVHTLYHSMPVPELLDVEDLTVYLQVPYGSDQERATFETLHELGVETFREESLNFIPEP